MDPFAGLGSTAIACAKLGIDFIGADIDGTYLAEAVTRARTAILDDAIGGKRVARVAQVFKPASAGQKPRAPVITIMRPQDC